MRVGRGKSTARAIEIVALACGLAWTAFPQKKEITQVLQLPKELPSAVEADPRHLSFYITPLSSKGLLSKQVRDALGVLRNQAKGDPIVKIRAFVAGSGDARRVRDLVSEVFDEHKQPLPVLSLVQSGGLPEEGAQVVMEGMIASRKELNPQGLVFISAQVISEPDPTGPVAPLAARALDKLGRAVKASGSEPADVVRVSCFLSSLQDVAATRKLVESEYRGAAANFVQTQRAPGRSLAACEAVAKLRHDVGARVQVMNLEGEPPEAGESQIALIAAPKVVLTGTQVAFGYEEKDTRLAFQRVQKSLEQLGVTTKDIAFAHFYPLGTKIASEIRQVRAEFFNQAMPPATSMLLFEGLPSMNAGFAMDVVAVK